MSTNKRAGLALGHRGCCRTSGGSGPSMQGRTLRVVEHFVHVRSTGPRTRIVRALPVGNKRGEGSSDAAHDCHELCPFMHYRVLPCAADVIRPVRAPLRRFVVYCWMVRDGTRYCW